MALTEMSSVLSVVNNMRAHACEKVGITTWRAAVALEILAANGGPLSNHDLQAEFLARRISSINSVGKDQSAAKSELLKLRCIQTDGNVAIFGITAKGLDILSAINEAMDEYAKVKLTEEERETVQHLKTVGKLAPRNKSAGSASLPQAIAKTQSGS